MANIIGRFYFKKTDSGNLIGEFSHNKHFRNFTESADLLEGDRNFIGKYLATWQEDGIACLNTLNIKIKEKSNEGIFSLKWEDNDKQTFWGEGILCDGILIGDYRNFEDIK